jgi:hypothetical protein
VATLSVIRRWALREQLSIREIARRTGLSRNTIKKYLALGWSSRTMPSAAVPASSIPTPKLVAGSRRNWPSRKQRRTLKQMHADLVALGFDGSYGRVAAFARVAGNASTRPSRPPAAAPSCRWCSAPGEAFQFDWSEDWASSAASAPSCRWRTSSSATAGRSPARLSAADPRDAVRCPQPRLPCAGRRAAPRHLRQHEDRRGPGGPWQGRDVNARFAAMASHFLFEPEFCNPASGWEKGQVEKNVQRCAASPVAGGAAFPLDELNAWLEERCKALWHEIEHGKLPGTSPMSGPQERASLMPPTVRSMASSSTPSASPDLPGALRAQPLQRAGVLSPTAR